MVIGLDIENHKYKTSTKGWLVYTETALNTIEQCDKLLSYLRCQVSDIADFGKVSCYLWNVLLWQLFFAHHILFYLPYLFFKYHLTKKKSHSKKLLAFLVIWIINIITVRTCHRFVN